MAKYISKVNEVENLVHVMRLRHGNKVFEAEARETKGAPQIYGAEYHLVEESGGKTSHQKEKVHCKYLTSIYDKKADD